MGSDASIYSLIKPAAAPTSPIAEYGQALQLKGLMGQNEIQQLQRQDMTQELAGKQRIRDLFAKYPTGDVPESEVFAANPQYGLTYQKGRLENKATQGKIDLNTIEVANKATAQHRDELAGVNDPQTAAQWVAAGYQNPVLAPILMRSKTLEQALQGIPQDPAQFQNWKQQNALGATKFIEMNKPHITSQNLGGTERIVSTPGLGGAPTVVDETKRTQGPDSVASNAVAIRGQNLADARARDKLDQDKFSQPFEATGPDGKPRLVMQNKNNGDIVDATTKAKVEGVAPKIEGSAQKQQTGVENTKTALGEYLKSLEGWTAIDAANPNARARMGTVYNNALLQAKEAFNLGVLNGPDYMILQQVLTDPASLKGTFTSNEAMKDQAKELKRIMGDIGKQVVKTQTDRPVGALGPAPAADIDAELRRRGVIK